LTEALLLKLDQWLAANRPDYYAMLRPGASEVGLDDFEREFSLRLPEAYRLLYRWRDGQAQDCTESFVQNFLFTSLADVRDSKRLLDGMTFRPKTVGLRAKYWCFTTTTSAAHCGR
jgi:cell wall assembly regulator SMI1